MNQAPARAASLYQRTWLLQLVALELHFVDGAIPADRDACSDLLAALFVPPILPNENGALRELPILLPHGASVHVVQEATCDQI